eukprot:CAMPEP_0171072570 /NCGR_PEP_ID=MMETSP0766_2-20121228/10947_1 /TAXON_ID=439317 /ORGANISM="Gambierdiscus australes, Strain CAWD 149" /LENGTH=57 /DNA_ID=CAMNT_0011529169 /DNA_START=17 /DNA_END=187 /DNA_ORIENTATION=+
MSAGTPEAGPATATGVKRVELGGGVPLGGVPDTPRVAAQLLLLHHPPVPACTRGGTK